MIEPRSIADEIAVSWLDLEQLERRHRFKCINDGINDDANDDIKDGRHRGGQEERDESASGSEHVGSAGPDRLRNVPHPESSGASATAQERALERLALLRARGHDVTAVSSFFRRRPNAAHDGQA